MLLAKTPQAVQKCHEILLRMIPQLDKFPHGFLIENKPTTTFTLVPTRCVGTLLGALRPTGKSLLEAILSSNLVVTIDHNLVSL